MAAAFSRNCILFAKFRDLYNLVKYYEKKPPNDLKIIFSSENVLLLPRNFATFSTTNVKSVLEKWGEMQKMNTQSFFQLYFITKETHKFSKKNARNHDNHVTHTAKIFTIGDKSSWNCPIRCCQISYYIVTEEFEYLLAV